MADLTESEFNCGSCNRIVFVITKGSIGFHAAGKRELKIIRDKSSSLKITIIDVEKGTGTVECPECKAETELDFRLLDAF